MVSANITSAPPSTAKVYLSTGVQINYNHEHVSTVGSSFSAGYENRFLQVKSHMMQGVALNTETAFVYPLSRDAMR